MGALDGGVELQFALRDVARCTLIVADLWACYVIFTGREVHVVMAGAAGVSCRVGEIRVSLCRSRVLLVAGFASPTGWMESRPLTSRPLHPQIL